MDIILRDYTCSKVAYIYNSDIGMIKEKKHTDLSAHFDGYLKNMLWGKIYAYWIDVNNDPILQYKDNKYYLYDNNISIRLKKRNFMYSFSLFQYDKEVLKIKYFRLMSFLDLDEIETKDFDFFYFVYSVWLNNPKLSQV